MEIKDIKNRISKPATKFITGGFRPENTIEESWIGKVFAFKANEKIPTDEKGNLMLPLAQLYLPNLPYIHPQIQHIKLVTVFISQDFPECFEPMGKNWVIRVYEDIDNLQLKQIPNPKSHIKAFPLKAEFVKEDYPIWDGGGLSFEIEKEICRLEQEGIIEGYYEDIGDQHAYEHKIGGYPSFCQPGVYFGEDYEFIFQISSDEKANFNVIDSGSLMFIRNAKTNQWKIYYDFY